MQKITHTFLTNLKANGQAQNIFCGEGPVLHVSPKAKKSWQLRYDTSSDQGKRKQNVVSLGEFPATACKRPVHRS